MVLQFVDDDWLAANDLLPPTPPGTTPSSPKTSTRRSSMDAVQGATVRSLRLKPVTSVLANSPCSEAVETMRDKGFDQLPVLAPRKGKLVGLVTLGNLLSYISRGRATGDSLVSSVMFDFSKISENLTNPYNLSKLSEALSDPRDTSDVLGNGKSEAVVANGKKKSTDRQSSHRHKFVEITMDTPLSALSRFLEWNSAAIVTEKDADNVRGLKPVAVVTKVDLLSWMMRHGKS